MTDTMTSQNIDLSSWDTLYTATRKRISKLVVPFNPAKPQINSLQKEIYWKKSGSSVDQTTKWTKMDNHKLQLVLSPRHPASCSMSIMDETRRGVKLWVHPRPTPWCLQRWVLK